MAAAHETVTPGSTGPLGNAKSPAPKRWQWIVGGAAAFLVHAAVALPFLPAPEEILETEIIEDTGPGIGVVLAPIIQPPEQEAPPEPEPETEIPVLEERADDSPPPAPPAEPREIPDIPDITPQAVPEIWTGGGGSGAGQMTLEEYLFLQDWLKAARAAVLQRLNYPEEARMRYLIGTAKVVIVADRSGKIIDYRFMISTGHRLLDREIERTIRSIRRLPRFPEATRYDTLSYVVFIRFELVTPDGAVIAPAEIEHQQQLQASAPAVENELSTAQIAQCASSALTLMRERDAIFAERQRLEAVREEYISETERYQRQRRDVPRRIERMRTQYERDAEAFGTRIDSFNQRSDAYGALCNSGSTSYENYAPACRPYLANGNRYCEAYATFWARLKAE